MKKTISVIVPIYNAEKYLHRCLNSIIRQTYSDLEVILVNDGSSDSSGSICEEYENEDRRFKVIHQENRGQASARNAGIEAATGEYLAFVDSDDWLDKTIYEDAIGLAEKTQSDVVDFQVEYAYTENVVVNQKQVKVDILKNKEILRNYLLRGQTEKAPFSPCRKLYEKYLFENVRFPVGKINEDIATVYKILMNTKKLAIMDRVGYYYFQNNKSTTRNGFKEKDFDLLDACKELELLTNNESYQDIKKLVRIKYARSYFSLLAKIAFYGVEDKNVDEKKVVKKLTGKLRKNYLILMTSNMPVNRKIMVSALSINIEFLRVPLSIYKNISEGVNK